MRFLILLSVLFFFSCSASQAEVAIRPIPEFEATFGASIPLLISKENETPFVYKSGALAFTIPKGHQLVIDDLPKACYDFYDFNENQTLQIFYDSVAVISQEGGGVYWINFQGEKVKEFGPNTSMERMREGLYLTYSPQINTGTRRKILESREYIYLNNEGENVFGDRSFMEAKPFSEGLAAVKSEPDGEWVYLNKKKGK